jgi:hypothetical protein
MENGMVAPGTYTLNIAGQYEDSGCSDSQDISVTILPIPAFVTSVLDVDGTFCHSEYSQIAVSSANENLTYLWECESCESDDFEKSSFLARWLNPEPGSGGWSPVNASYTLTATDTSTAQRCENSQTVQIEIQADYASCSEGLAWFAPNGLSVVDVPATYFQWYSVEADGAYTQITGATDQSYFPPDNVDDCAPERYIVATSLYPDRCWSTTTNCFETFGLRTCDGPKSARSAEEFVVYPNPVINGQIVLEEMQGVPESRYNLKVFDLAGKQLYGEQRNIDARSKNEISLPKLAYGVYMLEVSNLKFSKTFKIIVNK